MDSKTKKQPPGRVKIQQALRELLEGRDFQSIRIAEIARAAGVTEPLIYKYFRDKRDILYRLVEEYMENYEEQIERDLEGVSEPMEKLEKLIWRHIVSYDRDRVIARAIILELRNTADYYESKSFQLLKKYNELVMSIVEEGAGNGSIRGDVHPRFMTRLIMGSIDQFCTPPIIFNRPFSPDEYAKNLWNLVVKAIEKE
jgi:AcrR family transcriptional regulator